MERDRKETRRLGKVVLIGYRAAGKTTVGRLLAGRLGWSYVDVDRGIEEHCRLTIREIIERHGEPYYRDVESAVVAELCAGCERVVAFGAGTPMRAHNREHARRDSLVVYLDATRQPARSAAAIVTAVRQRGG